MDISTRTSCVCTDEKLLTDKPRLQYLLETMMIVRKFEEKVFGFFSKGLAHGTAHLGIGEEATGVGTTAALAADDYMLATHRGHGQAIGKGCDVNLMMAEILGKSTGLCHGRGGSMHIADFNKGMLGANGILGANAPLACGAAMTIKKKGLNRVSVAFFGDGASNEGAVHESMNLAAVWKLPVIFCLTNNQYGMSTAFNSVVNETDLTKRALGYGIKAFECDGNDVLQVYQFAQKAREYALNHGPVLLVEHTYRTSGHSKSDRNLYRTEEEIAVWKEHNPITRFSNFLLENNIFTQDEIKLTDEKTTKIIEDAVAWAESCPEPSIGDVLTDVYA